MSAQTITAKLLVNPVHIEERIPLSIGGSVEVGVSQRSSLQLSGLYRFDKQLSQGIDQGPKYYLDYRYYLRQLQQKNSGLYLSPYIGYGLLKLAEGDEPTGLVESEQMVETLTGVLIGYQPYKLARFSIDAYAGPEYQWRTKTTNYALGGNTQLALNRLWFRAGVSLSFRLKK
ncbi:hypothetical protein [Spirosoma soli]|uniref:hypothetical protein n=1 Tax=Spirosoma soli TaxID=1770529 RepID=UPI0036D33728